ncbi:murein L,D-transpeptidase family protein [Methylobacterium sp. R2-1]|uniref:L,D-transpeptidase family protein n=1 Tax=Methylobacterium sp. R2-1 TaxID=2587064 RepID=UPI00162269C0|nr:L,D-transpeptidase family protein [Methylobacterium sp. R2-1]MBB2960804.1 murein L,D-transpeptidase YafK [Methylobacterium sp. R2-1]
MARRGRIAAMIGGLAILAAGAIVLADVLQFGRTEPPLAAEPERADRVLVEKAARRLTLLREGRALAIYPVSLGFAPEGHKAREGDGRTPEGVYAVAFRNPRSVAHLSLKVSYPSPADEAAARASGYAPGGDIMIHGLMNGFSWLGRLHRLMDWTQGCVGVTNAEMRAIYARVEVGTPIEIRP